MFSRWFGGSVVTRRAIILEQLEDRIVLDAAVPASTDNHVDNQSSSTDSSAADLGTGTTDQTATDSGQSGGTSPESPETELEQADSSSAGEATVAVSGDASDASSSEETTVTVSSDVSGTSADDVRVLLVSSSLANADQLIEAAEPNVITVMYDGSTDTPATILSSIETALAGQGAESVALATHYLSEGEIELTSEYSMSPSSLDTSAALQEFWLGLGDLLTANGRVDLLACNLASSESGELLISRIESLTGHAVAASLDETGNPADGGDWILETGNVDLDVTYFDSTVLSDYQGLLANEEPVLSLNSGAGVLDVTFDDDGKLFTKLAGGTECAYAMAVDSNGKIVVVGTSNGDFAVARYNSNWTLDTTFGGGDGWVTTDLGSNDKAQCVAFQSDGMIIVGGAMGNYDLAVARYDTSGNLDTTFGESSGWTSVGGLDSNYDHPGAQGLAIQADDKIVTVATTSGHDFLLVRLNASGSMDTTFSGNGKLGTDFFGGWDQAYDVLIQPDGKIVVAGYAQRDNDIYYTDCDFAIARYLSDGTLDTTFSGDGKVLVEFGPSWNTQEDMAYAIALQSDGKIVAVGETRPGSGHDFAVARLNPDGSLDTSFSSDGKVTKSLSYTQKAEAVEIQPDGKIVVAGYSYMQASSNEDSVVMRFNSDGSWDSTFGDNGMVTTNVGGDEQAYDCLIQPDGKIVLAGNGANDFSFARYDASHLVYTNGDGALAIDTELTLTDGDDTNMSSASVKITGNYLDGQDKLSIDLGDLRGGVTVNWDSGTGIFTLNGTASKADYEYMLAHVKYTCMAGSGFPYPDVDPSPRTLSWMVTDSHGSDSETRLSTITYNIRAVVSDLGDTLVYTENDPATAIDGSVSVSDDDDDNMVSAIVRITSNYESGEDRLSIGSGDLLGGVSADWDSSTGTLTLTGSTTKANYESMLEHVAYENTSDDPHTAARTVEWTVNDGIADSLPETSSITVIAVNDPPELSGLGGTMTYLVGAEATVIDSSVGLTDPDNDSMDGAVIQITGNYQAGEDTLGIEAGFSLPTGVTASLTGDTLTVSGSATIAQYQSILEHVTYSNSSSNPNTADRTVTWTVNDGEDDSAGQTSTIEIRYRPALSGLGDTLAYTENDPATVIDGSITLTDPDSANMTSATIQISGNYAPGEDWIFEEKEEGARGG